MKSTLTSRTPWHAVLRIAAAVLGGYMLGMLLYLSAFLWAFAAPRLSRVWLVFAGGGALMAVLASLLQSQLT